MLARVALAHLLFAILQTASLSAQTINHTDSRQVAAFSTEPSVEGQHTLRESFDRAVDAHSIITDYEPALVTDNGANPPKQQTLEVEWEKIASQVLVFTAIQHSVRLTEEKTRRELAGSWTRDWFDSASSLFARPTWSDSGKFLTNYVFHPMGGSVYAHIYKQNDSLGRTLESGFNRDYITHFVRASVVSAVSSVQFELGPLSEASIGNVGLPPNQNKMAWVDVVITPTMGAAWMMGEDALDRYVIQRLERRIDSEVSRIVIRILLNPTRSVANVLRSEKPWKRDGRS